VGADASQQASASAGGADVTTDTSTAADSTANFPVGALLPPTNVAPAVNQFLAEMDDSPFLSAGSNSGGFMNPDLPGSLATSPFGTVTNPFGMVDSLFSQLGSNPASMAGAI
jgi:hypothetical protein